MGRRDAGTPLLRLCNGTNHHRPSTSIQWKHGTWACFRSRVVSCEDRGQGARAKLERTSLTACLAMFSYIRIAFGSRFYGIQSHERGKPVRVFHPPCQRPRPLCGPACFARARALDRHASLSVLSGLHARVGSSSWFDRVIHPVSHGSGSSDWVDAQQRASVRVPTIHSAQADQAHAHRQGVERVRDALQGPPRTSTWR